MSENIEILQSSVTQVTQQKYKILQKLKDTQDNLEKIKKENDELIRKTHKAQDQNLILENKYQDLLRERQYVNDKGYYAINSLQKELQMKEFEIENLQDQIKEREGSIRVMSIAHDHNSKGIEITSLEIENLKKENTELKEKIEGLESKLDDFYVNRRSESALLLEIEHLKQDNLRLLNLLKATEDYKDFAYLAEDNTGGVMFVKAKDEVKIPTSSSRRSASSSGLHTKPNKYGRKENVETSAKNDENWVQVEV